MKVSAISVPFFYWRHLIYHELLISLGNYWIGLIGKDFTRFIIINESIVFLPCNHRY
jgi:hypothetical protein